MTPFTMTMIVGFVFLFRKSHCVDVDYISRVEIVIAAPQDQRKGSLVVDVGYRIYAPGQGDGAFRCVDVNQQFLVGSQQRIEGGWVHVFQSHYPYKLRVTFPLPKHNFAETVAINDCNTIVVGATVNPQKCYFYVYKYDGKSVWHRWQVDELLNCYNGPGAYISSAISNDTIVLGHCTPDAIGKVIIYKEENGHWNPKQTLVQQDIKWFGFKLAMEGEHLAVLSASDVVSTYNLDGSTGQWIHNRLLPLPPRITVSSHAIDDGIMVVSVKDTENHPEVCGIAYKAYKVSQQANNANRSASTFLWKEVARLATKGDPVTSRQYHAAVRKQNGLVFTSRVDPDGFGKVFVHRVTNI